MQYTKHDFLIVTEIDIMFLNTITVLLSILRRNIQRKHFKDTKKVNAFIYLFIVISLIGYSLSQFVTNREIQVYFTFIGINSHAILCQTFLFLPKCLPPFLRHLKLDYWKTALKNKQSTTSKEENTLLTPVLL